MYTRIAPVYYTTLTMHLARVKTLFSSQPLELQVCMTAVLHVGIVVVCSCCTCFRHKKCTTPHYELLINWCKMPKIPSKVRPWSHYGHVSVYVTVLPTFHWSHLRFYT